MGMTKAQAQVLLKVRSDLKDLKQTNREIRDLTRKMVEGGKAGRRFAKAMDFNFVKQTIGALGFAGGITAVVVAAKKFVSTGISFNATIEETQVAFETLLGSADAAERRINKLIQFAATTPFELPEVVEANRVLQALAGSALAGGEAFTLIGDAAAASGRGFSEVAMWVGRVYAGLKSGTPIGEATLRLLEMGLISGKTKLHLEELATQAHSDAEVIAILGDTFAGTMGAMEKQSQTFNGLLSTLRDTFSQFAADIGKPIFEDLKQGMRETIELMRGMRAEADMAMDLDMKQKDVIARAQTATTPEEVEIVLKQARTLREVRNREGVDALDKNAALTSIPRGNGYTFVPGVGPMATISPRPSDENLSRAVNEAAAKMAELDAVIAELETRGIEAVASDNAAAAAESKAEELRQNYAGLSSQILNTQATLDESGRLRLDQLHDEIIAIRARADEEAKAADDADTINLIRIDEENKVIALRREAAVILRKAREEEAQQLIANVRLQESLTQELRETLRAERERAEAAGDKEAVHVAIEKEREAVAELAAMYLELAAAIESADPAAAAQYRAKAAGLQRQGAAMGDDRPEGMVGGLDAATGQFSMTWGEQWQEASLNVATTMRESIGDALMDLVTRSKTLGQALNSVALSFGRSMLKAILDMGAQWAVQMGLMFVKYAVTKSGMFALDQVFAAKGLALSLANAAKSLVAWIPSAIAASISSWGLAAGIGLAAVAAVGLMGGFADGGYTGDGGKYEPAGIVHKGEVVWSQEDIARAGGLAQVERARHMGLSRLQASRPMPAGADSLIASDGGSGSSGGGEDLSEQPVGVHLWDRRPSSIAALNTKAGEDAVIRAMERHPGRVVRILRKYGRA